MIQMQSRLDVADNTGAKSVMCIKVLAVPSVATPASVTSSRSPSGSRAARPRQEGRGLQRRGRAHRQGVRRQDGSLVRFDGNAAAVLLNAKLEPIGTRIFGPVTRELRTERFMKIVSLAPEVL